MAYKLISTIQVFEGDAADAKPTDAAAGSRLRERDTGREFVAKRFGYKDQELRWDEVSDSQLSSIDSRLIAVSNYTSGLLAELKRTNLLLETGFGPEISVDDVEN